MTLAKRIAATALTLALLAATAAIGANKNNITADDTKLKNELTAPKQTLHLWYTDEALTDYIASVSLDFYEDKDIRIIPKCISGLEYLEKIYDASVNTSEYPDVYLIGNDSLEKAFLAGAASEIQDKEKIAILGGYSDAAINAVTYKDKIIAYPFYFETSVFLYNKTYMEDIAEKAILAEQAEAAEQSQEEPQTAISEEIPQEQITERMIQMLPKTIDDILKLADNYDAPENVEAVFKWDVADIFYNYFFVGNSINIGGKSGDNPQEIDIYNKNALESLKVYQEMNQFFAIDTKEVNYEGVLQDFIDGKIVFSVVTTDAIRKMEEAKKEGKFAYDYGIETIPDINADISSSSLSVTNALVVNAYSDQKEAANEFARYLTHDSADALYPKTGKVPSKKGVTFENKKVEKAVEEYEYSVPITKMIEASNFWVQLEICFTKVWNGENANDQLKNLSEQIMTQITGEPYTEEYMEEPQTVPEESVEYIDEETTTGSETR